MDIKSFFKNRTILITLGGVALTAIVIAAIYLPGTLYRGAATQEVTAPASRSLVSTEETSPESAEETTFADTKALDTLRTAPEESELTCEPVSLSQDGKFYVGEEMKWKATITPEPTTAPLYTWAGIDLTQTTGQEIPVTYMSGGIKKVSLTATFVPISALVGAPGELTARCTVLIEEAVADDDQSTTEPTADFTPDFVRLPALPREVKRVKAICQGSPSTPEINETVAWTALTDGLEDKTDVEYVWGADAADASGTGKTVYSQYSDAGIKTASLKITYAEGDPISTRCSVSVKEAEVAEVVDDDDEPVVCPILIDIEGHWAESYIEHGYELGLFSGYPDCTFKPDKPASRAEATSMIIYSKGIDPVADCDSDDCGTPFDDISAPENGIIKAAYDNGLVEGYKGMGYENMFAPNFTITRFEAASLIVRASFEPFVGCYTAHCGAGWPNNFFDDLHDEQGKYVRVLWDLRIMEGPAGVKNRVEPDRPITRAEMAKLIVLAYEETH